MTFTEGTYVDKAEKVILGLKSKKNKNGKTVPMVTTSKLRKIYAITADIYNQVMNEQKEVLSADVVGRIEYLRVRIIYEAGRENDVKSFVEDSELLENIKEIKASRKNFLLFNHYMEALVAFHKFHGGKEF